MSAVIVNQNAPAKHEVGALYIIEAEYAKGNILLGTYEGIISLSNPTKTWLPGKQDGVTLNGHLTALKARRLPKGTVIEFTSEK